MFPQEKNVNHFYQKMHTAAQISTKRPALYDLVGSQPALGD